MYCPQCGTQNDDQSAHCIQCGTRLTPQQQPGGQQMTPPQQPFAPQFGQPQQPFQQQAPFGQQPQFGQQVPMGQQPQFGQQPPMGQLNPGMAASIPSYMTQSILVTFCCCLIGGIMGIFKANKVNRLLALGDYDGAMQASKENKQLLWISFGIGIVVQGGYFLVAIIGGMSGSH